MALWQLVKNLFWAVFVWRVNYPDASTFYGRIRTYLRDFGPRSIVILTQDVGHSEGDTPGVGNEKMAQIVRGLHAEFPTIPILAQLAVARALPDVPLAATIGPPPTGAPLDRSTLGYNTYSVCTDQRAWCVKNGYWPVLALAMTTPDHMPRTLRVMRKVGFQWVWPIPLPSYSQIDYLDAKAQYPRMRIGGMWPQPLGYRVQELLGRLLFIYKGWV